MEPPRQGSDFVLVTHDDGPEAALRRDWFFTTDDGAHVLWTYVAEEDGWEKVDGSIEHREFRAALRKMLNEAYGESTGQHQSSGLVNLPRIWSVFPFILSRSIRERVYEPAHEELKDDYILARKACRTRLEHNWITFCFTARTGALVLESGRASLGDKGPRALKWLCGLLLGKHFLGELWNVFRSFRL